MSLRLLYLVTVLGLVALLTACGGNGSSSNPTQPPAPTLSFTADSTSVNSGQAVTLTWSSKNATSVTIAPSIGSGTLPLAGSQQVTVSANTTYTATATGPGGTTKLTISITVTNAPPTLTFTSSATSVTAGSIVTLTWSTTNATTFTVTPSILGEDQTSLALSGSTTVVINTTTTFTATATGAGGSATQSVTVTVAAAAPTITLTAAPTSIGPGGSSTLTWATTNTTSVSINNNVGTALQPSGSETVSPSATTTYTATATGPGGTATTTATVSVTAGLSITLTASPTSVTPGQSSTLTWVSSGGTGTISVSISGVNGTQADSGSISISPSSTTTYTATATDGGGNTATSTATVTVVTSTGGLSTIKHIIFMLQENRTFDNYFGKLGAYRASEVSGASPSDVNDLDSLPANFTLLTRTDAPNPSYPIPPFHQRTLQTENLSPSWNESHYDAHLVGQDYMNVTASSQFKMDFFLQTTHSVSPDKYDPDGTRPMGYYDQTDLPYYYELATQFATSDAFHSSLLSQTNPNRMYLFAATSIGRCNADPTGHPLWPAPTIFDELQTAGITWRYYYQTGVFLSQFQSWSNPQIQNQVWNISNLFTILASPNADQQLPQVIFIEKGDTTDEHPDNNIQAGAVLVKQILDALMSSSAWKDSIFILAYDEGGGLYDHVPPFLVSPPDNITPNCPTLTQGLFNLSGFRVPVVVVSPYVKPHYVSHTNMETTSILKLIETRFNLPALTQRDANAPDMTEFFDFTNPYWLTPPPLPDQPNECLSNSQRCNQQLEVYPNLP